MPFHPASSPRRYWFISAALVVTCFTFPLRRSLAQQVAVEVHEPLRYESLEASAAVREFAQHLSVFGPLLRSAPNAYFSIKLCADVPDNSLPLRVHVGDETGHVFIILTMFDPLSSADTLYQVYGFYPRRPVSSVLFKNARSEVLPSDGREYNASIEQQVDRATFRELIRLSIGLAHRKYNINRFNCYDYAINIYNSLPAIKPLPVHHVKFPFIFGKGGSPCGLYADLEALRLSGNTNSGRIRVGIFNAPSGTKSAAAGGRDISVH